MNILVIGGGGREHAIIKGLKKSPQITKIFALPGNGGISYDAVCHSVNVMDFDSVIDFAFKNNVNFAVVGPDDPLAMGAVDRLTSFGIPTFGPTASASIIESSKVFAKNLMKKYDIPTAEYQVFDSYNSAISYVENIDSFPIVLKADGLALGKGVIIANSLKEALDGIDAIMKDKIFGDSGNRILVEEYLSGPEVSVLAFTDSATLVPMVSSMDHKRAFDGDLGPNTGGMGAVAPNPFYTEDIAKQCMDEIFMPTIHAMNKEGRPFKGCLYFGLMLTKRGPRVIEYNCRFGDPEAQVVLPLLKTDLFSIMKAVVQGNLSKIEVEFENRAACCVIAASGGYPGKYETGLPISGLDNGSLDDVLVFHAGTKKVDKSLHTSGGRVLGVTALDDDMCKAIDKAYDALKKIDFKDMHYRKDIGRISNPNLPKE